MESLKELRSLQLNSNALQSTAGIPPLKLLTHLSLQDNGITAIGKELMSLPALKELRLDNNEISAIENIPRGLAYLNLSGNRIAKLEVGMDLLLERRPTGRPVTPPFCLVEQFLAAGSHGTCCCRFLQRNTPMPHRLTEHAHAAFLLLGSHLDEVPGGPHHHGQRDHSYRAAAQSATCASLGLTAPPLGGVASALTIPFFTPPWGSRSSPSRRRTFTHVSRCVVAWSSWSSWTCRGTG